MRRISILSYYQSLHNHHRIDDMKEREDRIRNSETTSLSYYRALKFNTPSIIYSSFMDDVKRSIITRWRLSNHRLKIELGRYQRPIIKRHERLCDTCEVLDDEAHAIFFCSRFNHIRARNRDLLLRNDNVQKFLNPSMGDKEKVASFLTDMEKVLI